MVDEVRQTENVDLNTSTVESLQETEETIIDSKKEIDLTNNEIRSQQQLSTLNTSISGGGREATTEVLSEQEQLMRNVEYLLGEYKKLDKGIKSREGNRETKRDLRHRLNENIENLEAIKNDLGVYKYHNLTTYKARVGELMYYFEHYEQIRQLIVLGQRTGDIHAIIDSKQDARYARRQERREAKYQSDMNDILHDAAITSLRNNDMERYEEYLEAVLNGQVEPSTHPFYTAHRQSFEIIQSTNPTLYEALVPGGGSRISYDTYCQRNPSYETCSQRGNRVCRRNNNTFRRFGERFSNMLEQIFPNGMNKDPRQKEAWTNIGSVLAVGGAIFMGIKAITSLKKGADGKRNRGAALGWTAGTLALLNSDRVLQTLQDALNIHPAERTRIVTDILSKYNFTDAEAMAIADRYVGAPVATISALHFIPIYELHNQNIVEEKDSQLSFNYDNYKKYIDTLELTREQKKQLLDLGKKIQNDNLIGLGLGTFGISSIDDLRRMYNGNNSMTLAQAPQVQQGRDNCVERISSGVNAELYKHGLKIKNSNDIDKILKEYEDSPKDRKSINELIKKWMKGDLLEIANNDANYTVQEMLNNPDIDIENMTMKGFKNGANEIQFESYGDLFYTVYLTNWVKQNFNRPAVSMNPFHINLVTGRIEFDDTKRYELHKTDTNIVKNSTLKENSSLLSKNKEFYVNYLNEWRRGVRKIDTDPTKYPMVSKLGIDFYSDENEIQELETWLNNIKIRLTSAGRVPKKPNPFSFGILGTGIIDKLMFKPASGSSETIDTDLSSKFPTIRKNGDNKDKLLKFLNDPTNGMCNRY